MALSKEEIEKLDRIEHAVSKFRGRVTYADVSQETGFSLNEVEDLMYNMMERYRCRPGMNTSTGDVVLNFLYPLYRRDKKTFKEQLIKAGNATLKVLKAVYRAAIGVVMIAYAVIFALILIAMTFAGGRSDNDSDDDSGSMFGPMLFSMFFDLLRSIFFYNAVVNDSYDTFGNRRPKNRKGKKALEAIYHFVFGPDKPKTDSLNDSKEVIAFIRNNSGKLSAGNISALTGLTLDAAEDKLAEYAGKFHGELEISTNGTVVCNFRQLMFSAVGRDRSDRVVYYKNEPEPTVEFTGNTSGANFGVIAVNCFNLIMSWSLMDYNNVTIWLGLFPFIVSALYFVIPLLRIPSYLKSKKRRSKSLYRKALVGLVTDYPGHNFTEEDFANVINMVAKDEVPAIGSGIIKSVNSEVIRNYGGVAEINSAGKAIYRFGQLEKELNYQHN